jgi:hypothetical protein
LSLISDILDRLSGVAVVKAELEQTAKRLDRLADLMMNHETRLARVEGVLAATTGVVPAAHSSTKRLPKTPK